MGTAGLICTAILLLFSLVVTAAGGASVFDVVGYGARGDGQTDDTKAFKAAWAAACGAKAPSATMLVPASRTSFLVGPVQFQGPCASQKITVQINGTIVAPTASKWSRGQEDHWLMFSGVDGLTVTGNGLLNGNGESWWIRRCSHSNDCAESAPTALKLVECNNLELSNFRSNNSPMMHIVISKSSSVYVKRLSITAPGNSPNTDGIHISQSKDVWITNSWIGTGDDCVSIVSGSSFVAVQGVTCGPGHGVSVGGLGKNGADAAVEYIDVSNVHLINTTNGVRIKTWQGGEGYAKSISFRDIEFTNVDNPVLINQFYVGLKHTPVKYTADYVQGAVAISNITYTNLSGTSSKKTAVAFECSTAGSCTDIHVKNLRITGSGAQGTVARCVNVQGDTSGYVYPTIPCLK